VYSLLIWLTLNLADWNWKLFWCPYFADLQCFRLRPNGRIYVHRKCQYIKIWDKRT